MSAYGGFLTGLAGAGNYYSSRDRRALDRDNYKLDKEIFEENKRAAGVREKQNQQQLNREDEQQANYNAEAKRKQYEFDTGNKQHKANGIVSLAMDPSNKWWTPASGITTFDKNAYQASLDSNNTASADQMALHVANMQAKDPNFVFDNVRRHGGKIYIEGTYVDGPNKGQKGVANESGDADPNSPVLEYTTETLTNDVASEWIGITHRSSVLGGENGVKFLALNGAGQDRLQSVRDSKEAELQAVVEDAAEGASHQAGSLELVRGFKRALANAGDDREARRKILLDMADTLGVDTSGIEFGEAPASIVHPETKEMVGAKGVSYGHLPKGASAKVRQYDISIARLEKDISRGGSDEQLEKYYTELEQNTAARTELVNEANQKSLSDAQTRLADLTAKAEKADGTRKDFWNKQAAKEQAKLDELIKAGVVTPATKTEAWADLRSRVLDNIEDMNPEQVDAMVESGKIKFTSEDVAAMKQRAEELEIKTIEDIAKLPTKEQIGFRALLGVISDSPAERQYMRETLDNLTETGDMSISAQDAVTNKLNTENAITNRMNVRASIARNNAAARNSGDAKKMKAGEHASAFQKSYTDLLYEMGDGESGELIQDVDAARQVARLVPGYLLKINAYGVGTPEYDLAIAPVNAAISDIIGVYAEDGDSPWGQEFMSFFRPDPTGDNTDFDLRRITVDDPENPTTFFYRGSSTDSKGDNNAVVEGAGFRINTFANDISRSISDVILKQAIANTKARLGK